jgi:hypothetical protein
MAGMSQHAGFRNGEAATQGSYGLAVAQGRVNDGAIAALAHTARAGHRRLPRGGVDKESNIIKHNQPRPEGLGRHMPSAMNRSPVASRHRWGDLLAVHEPTRVESFTQCTEGRAHTALLNSRWRPRSARLVHPATSDVLPSNGNRLRVLRAAWRAEDREENSQVSRIQFSVYVPTQTDEESDRETAELKQRIKETRINNPPMMPADFSCN